MGQSCRDHDDQFRREEASFFSTTRLLGRGELKCKGGGKKTVHYNGSEETVELILRTIISVNQLNIYGAVADLCNELFPDYAQSVVCESLVIPTESADANTKSQSSTSSAQGNMLQDYIFRNSQQFLKIKNGRNFAMPKIHSLSRLHNISTKSVDLVKYEDRYCIDIIIESLFQDRTVSWVRVVNGVNKYVTETSEEIPTENVDLFISTGKPVAKAKPKTKLGVNCLPTQFQ